VQNYWNNLKQYWYVECLECKARGPVSSISGKDAKENWNSIIHDSALNAAKLITISVSNNNKQKLKEEIGMLDKCNALPTYE
jgi:hypothetical protein